MAITLIAGRWLIPASTVAGSGRLDLAGAALSVAAFTGLTYTIIEAPSHGWLSLRTLGLGVLSVALLALFVAWEARASHPMLPLRLFRNPRFAGAGLSITVLFFALSGVVFLSSQIYQFVLGYSPLAAGLRALPSAAALAVFSPVGAFLAKRAGVRVPVTLGLVMFGSIAASVFAGRMGGVSLGTAAAAGHRPGGAAVLHAAADAFVSGADRAVLAGAIVVAVGLVAASRAFRPTPVAVAAPAQGGETGGVPVLEVAGH